MVRDSLYYVDGLNWNFKSTIQATKELFSPSLWSLDEKHEYEEIFDKCTISVY